MAQAQLCPHCGAVFKVCPRCGCAKTKGDFAADNSRADKLGVYCRECVAKMDAQRVEPARNGNGSSLIVRETV